MLTVPSPSLLAALFAALAGLVLFADGHPYAAAANLVAAVLLLVAELRRRGHAAQHALQLPVDLAGPVELRERLGAEVSRARRHDLPLAVLRVDLEGLGALRDERGADVATEALRRVVLGVAGALRGEDVVARSGPGQLAVILPGATGMDVARVAARVVAAVERVASGQDEDAPRLTSATGAASFPRDGASADALLATAEEHLAEARREREVARADLRARLAAVTGSSGAPATPDALWSLGRPLLAWGVVSAIAVLAWFALPLVADAAHARTATLIVLLLGFGAVTVLCARRATGRERAGWALLTLSAAIFFVPVASLFAGVAAALALLLIAGDGWSADRMRCGDAACLALVALGAFSAFAVPAVGDDLGTVGVLAVSVTVAALISALALVVAGVDGRRRPDVALLIAGLAFGLVLTVLDPMLGGKLPAVSEDWQVLLAFALSTCVGGALARLSLDGAPTRALRPPRPDRAVGVTVGTAAICALLLGCVAVLGEVPAVTALALIATLLLRHGRTRLVAGENRRLVNEALRSQAARTRAQRASLVALTAALEARDGYTGRHGEETVCLAVAVADALGLEGREREEVETVALLHDIGKIGTPNEILHKPGPLNDQEWLVMREHPVVGERILRTVPGLEGVARAVRHEHERWDGEGYPDGLDGEGIPLASRVVLVCDAYHAMTSNRPYRTALPPEHALKELRRCAGTQFDPAAVEALVDVLAAPSAIAPEVPAEAAAQPSAA